MNCPNDGSPLQQAELDHITVFDCPTCKGTWFPHDELDRAKANADNLVRWIDFDIFAVAEASAHPGDRACPVCLQPMAALEYPHSKVQVDACAADDGIWLDNGEFGKIVSSLDEVTTTMSTGELEHAAVDQLKEVFAGHSESRVGEVRDFMAVFRLLEVRLGVEHPKVAAAVNALSAFGF